VRQGSEPGIDRGEIDGGVDRVLGEGGADKAHGHAASAPAAQTILPLMGE